MALAHVAFFMGHHDRLGQHSSLHHQDDLIMRKSAHMAFGCAEMTPLAVLASVVPSAHEALYSAPVATPQDPEAGEGDPMNILVEEIGAPSAHEALNIMVSSTLPQDPEAGDPCDVFLKEEEEEWEDKEEVLGFRV